MSEMVERVARALAEVEFKMPGAGGLRGRLRLAPAQARELACAAIGAMRKPNAAILSAMRDDVPVDGHEWEWLDDQAESYWRAMIDAALKDAP